MKQPKDYIDNCYKNHSNFLIWEGNIPYNKLDYFQYCKNLNKCRLI